MEGSTQELRNIDIIDRISKTIDDPVTRDIIMYFINHQSEDILLETLAEKIRTTPVKVENAMIRLIEKNAAHSKASGDSKLYKWNQNSKEGKILFHLFSEVKNVDEFFTTLARFCELYLDRELLEDLKFSDFLSSNTILKEKKPRSEKPIDQTKEEKPKAQQRTQSLNLRTQKYLGPQNGLEDGLEEPSKHQEFSFKKSPYRKPTALSKLKSLFKIEPSNDYAIKRSASKTDVIKPDVMSMPNVGEAIALQIPGLQECIVCQGEIDAGETFIKCSCELITHVDCVKKDQICPQCGRELDLELILPDKLKKKTVTKKPTIHREKKREIEELSPPNKSFFSHVPEVTNENRIKNFVSSYYNKHNMGKLTQTKNISDINMFISAKTVKKMLDHCYNEGIEKEVMGLILGETYKHGDKIFSIAKDAATSDLDASTVHVRFDTFDKLFEELDQIRFDYQIIGWYHSHPNYSSYMSNTDTKTQKRMFKHKYQYAVVIDPIKFDMKAFALDHDQEGKTKTMERGFAIIDF